MRLGLPRFPVNQNLQLPRIIDILNPDVEVIYVSPFPLDDEIIDYFKKILQIGGVEKPSTKLTVVVPENTDAFPAHLPLSSVLMYSPYAMHRIRQICKTKAGYIVGGFQGWQERRLCLELNLPIMQAELQICSSCVPIANKNVLDSKSYSTKFNGENDWQKIRNTENIASVHKSVCVS